MKTALKLLYAIIVIIGEAAVPVILGVILMKVVPTGGWHVFGVVLVWLGCTYGAVSLLAFGLNIWLKAEDHRFWQRIRAKR